MLLGLVHKRMENIFSHIRNEWERRRLMREFPARFAGKGSRTADVAVILHLFYFDLWQDIRHYLANIPVEFDLYVSVPPRFAPDVVRDLLRSYPQAMLKVCANRGRDIAPFIQFLTEICDYRYTAVCKIHSKKSLHLADGRGWKADNGESWRNQLYEELLGSTLLVKRILAEFDQDDRLGMVGPAGSLLNYLDVVGDNRENVQELMRRLRIDQEDFSFFAGSMFWFRPAALAALAHLKIQLKDYAPEKGQVDGTLAHAIERVLAEVVRQNGMNVRSSSDL